MRRIRSDYKYLRNTPRTERLIQNMLALFDALQSGATLPVDPLFLKQDANNSYLVFDQRRRPVGSVLRSGVGQFRPDPWRWSM